MEFTDINGIRWQVVIISHGRTSAYLNPRVHRPILQFSCLDKPLPKRYHAFPDDADCLEDLSPESLRVLLEEAKTH